MAKAPLFEVETLAGDGRLEEAAVALKRAARAGAQAWEVYLWAGRIEERKGRLAGAERAYRRALGADPASASPRAELARFLEKAGRPDEAVGVWREAAAEDAEKLSVLSAGLAQRGSNGAGRLERLLEFDLYRRALLAEVMKRNAGLGRVEAALKAEPRLVGVRMLLAEILIARGSHARAERELSHAFAPGSAGAETFRLEVLLKLVDRGRYGPVLERGLLSHVRQAPQAARIWADWPQIFSALACGHRYHAAFRLGEAVLKRPAGRLACRELLWPWWRKVGRGLGEERFCARELRFLRRAGRTGGFPHWFAYCRAILLFNLDRKKEALAEHERLGRLPQARYFWMHQLFLLIRLVMDDFDGAIIVSRRILRRAPWHWWARCRLGEAYLAKGDTAQGLREFERAEGACDVFARREVLTWHGEVLLWLGNYREALEKLNEAVRLGARTFVDGWRGAAYLKLGDFPKALAELDRAIALDPKDFEARVWRGEAYRMLGRYPEALEDLDRAIQGVPQCCWGYFNRALAREALGDEAGLASDFAALPEDVVAFLRRKLAIAPGRALSRAEMRRILMAGLEQAKGIRRAENYLKPIWMGRG